MQLRKSPLKPTACSSSRERWGETCAAEGLRDDIDVCGAAGDGDEVKRSQSAGTRHNKINLERTNQTVTSVATNMISSRISAVAAAPRGRGTAAGAAGRGSSQANKRQRKEKSSVEGLTETRE